MADTDRVKAEVRDAHARRNEAWRRRDGQAYLSFYADDATIFVAGCLFTRVQLVERVTTMLAGGGGAISVELDPLEDIVAGPGGDAAVVTCFWKQRIRYADGNEADASVFESDVWYLRDGTWRLVRAHLTRL